MNNHKKSSIQTLRSGLLWISNHIFCVFLLVLFISLCFFNNNGVNTYKSFWVFLTVLILMGLLLFVYYHIIVVTHVVAGAGTNASPHDIVGTGGIEPTAIAMPPTKTLGVPS